MSAPAPACGGLDGGRGAGTRLPRLAFLVLVTALAPLLLGGVAAAGTAELVLFWGEGCPHCAVAKPFLEGLAAEPGVTLRSFEVYRDGENRRLFAAAGRSFGFEPGSVPTILIGDEVYVGFSDAVARTLEERVGACLQHGCPDPWLRIAAAAGVAPAGPHAAAGRAPAPGAAGTDPAGGAPAAAAGGPLAAAGAGVPGAPTSLTLPLVGTVALAGRSEVATTALIALVDGFNPCSLWVLSLLLAVVINTRSRRKVILIGATFLVVAAAVYALLLAGMVNLLGLVAVLPWVRWVVAAIALGFAAVNLKDYLWWGRGPSLTIPEGRKPGIYRGIRSVMAKERHTAAMVGATAVMAAGVTLFELPCTVGFPVLWADMVVQWKPGLAAFWGLLLVYLLVFLADELALFGVAVATLRASRLEERHGRLLKLVGGMVMLFLAATLLLAPAWMNALLPATAVVAAALLTAAAIHLTVRALTRPPRHATSGSVARTPAHAPRAATPRPRARRGR